MQNSLSYAGSLFVFVRQGQIIKHSLSDHPVHTWLTNRQSTAKSHVKIFFQHSLDPHEWFQNQTFFKHI